MYNSRNMTIRAKKKNQKRNQYWESVQGGRKTWKTWALQFLITTRSSKP